MHYNFYFSHNLLINILIFYVIHKLTLLTIFIYIFLGISKKLICIQLLFIISFMSKKIPIIRLRKMNYSFEDIIILIILKIYKIKN